MTLRNRQMVVAIGIVDGSFPAERILRVSPR